NSKEVFINDYISDFHRYFPNTPMPDPKVGEMPDSVIYLPVYVKGEAIGVITVQSFRKYAYSEYHLNILRNLAVYVAIAVENAEAYQELENSRKEIADQKSVIEVSSDELTKQKEQIANAYQDFKLLAGLGRDITTNLKIEDIVMAAHKALSNLMDTSIFTIGIYHEDDQTLNMPLTIEDGQVLEAHSYSVKDNEHRMAVWCFRNADEVLISDYAAEYNNYFPDVPLATPKIGELPKSVIYLPIFSKGDVIGVITVQTMQASAYNQYHLNFIKNLAVYVGIALENAEAYERIEASKAEIDEQKQVIEQSYENIKLLGQIGKDIISKLEVEAIVETVYENVNALMDAPIFSIGMFNPDNQKIEVTGSIEDYDKLPFHSYSIESKNSLSVLCFLEKKEIIIRDCQKEFGLYLPNAPLPTPDVGALPESIIYLPLQAKDKTVGVLTVQSFKKHAYDDYHIDILRNMAVYISIALENADALRRIEMSKTEIAEQSKLLEQAFNNVKLLKNIGQGITASLSVQKIIETVYANVNDLMDAAVFWIGAYNKSQQCIEFKGAKEKGKTLDDFSISLDEKDKLAIWCFEHQKEVFINDVEHDYSKYIERRSAPVVGDLAESIIYIPLTANDKKLGVLTIQSFEKNAYTNYHLDILQNLATYIFIALENARLYENMEEKVRERTAEVEAQRDQINQSFENIKLLSDIGQDIIGSLSIDAIVSRVYDNVNNLMDATTFGIGVVDRSQGKIVFRGAIEKGIKLPEFYHPIDDERRFSVWAINNLEAVFINDFKKEFKKYIPSMKNAAAGDDAESILYVPLTTQNGCIGVITVQSFKKNAYTPYHLDLLKNLAVYIGIALENAEAYRNIEDFSNRIESTNQKLTSSINYAKRIQDAILPQMETIRRHLPNSFVFYKPRDIVSGDFYWIYENYGKIFVAAIDCTGHGVPGAFMSMVGNDLLNEVVVNIGYEEPDYILSELHMGIRNALSQDKTDNRDGMDVALCIIDTKANRLDYAGAKRPLVYVKNGEIHEIKPTRLSVGGYQQKTYRSYKKHSISTAGVDAFYLYSDGYQDQFGGDSKRKFRSRDFKSLLLNIHAKPMDEQRDILESTLERWMGDTKQIDDILVMGFKV
ncbi:MAG: GAF domain-containing protein, partial [Flammeovirgaceae bacterium]